MSAGVNEDSGEHTPNPRRFQMIFGGPTMGLHSPCRGTLERATMTSARPARLWGFLPVLSAIVGSSAIAVLLAQPAQTPSFTAAQAAAGRTAYERSCAGCHRADLQGSFEAPQLSGSNFLNQWGHKTIVGLQTYLMASMPPTDPGSPGPDTMINIVA